MAIKNFRKDSFERFVVMPINTQILKHAGEIINKHGAQFSIRTLDAIQLSACREENSDQMRFVCADSNLIRICKMEGIDAVNPETEFVA